MRSWGISGDRALQDELLFSGMRVLDVGTWIAAPTAATMLADRGADVIKIEQPGVGDAYRNYYQAVVSPESTINYTWALDARNKRSLSLNLKSAAGKAILERLVRECDVYVTNQPLPCGVRSGSSTRISKLLIRA